MALNFQVTVSTNAKRNKYELNKYRRVRAVIFSYEELDLI